MSTTRNMKGRRGFSLIEIIVVLVVLGAAALLVAPSFTNGLRGLELRSAASDLAVRFRMARTRAISSQKVHRVFVGLDETSKPFYALADEYEQVLKTYSLPEGVSIVTQDEAELPLRISFYPNGRSSGATFALVGSRNRRVAIAVDPVTGLGRVVRNETPES